MKQFSKGLIGIFFVLGICGMPALALAQTSGGSATLPTSGGSAVSPTSGGVSCPAGAVCLTNPVSQYGTFCGLLKQIFNDILLLGIPVATLFIVWAGFRLVLARGNEEGLRSAKRNLYYIVIGIAIFLGAWTLSQIIANTLSTLSQGSVGGICS